jgi:predicted RNA-binding Zn ribbon-like protein
MVTMIRDQSFSFRSGRLALDFAATLMFRDTPEGPRELLPDPGALAAWTVAAGILDSEPSITDEEWAAALALREAIYRLTVAAAEGRGPRAADRELLNRIAASPPATLELAGFGRLGRRGDPDQALATIARDAVALLGSADVMRLRQCRRSGCTRLFVDRSRGGNRVWCGMRECGNRVNAAAYRRRSRPTA